MMLYRNNIMCCSASCAYVWFLRPKIRMWFEEKWAESTSKSVIPYDNLKKKGAYQLGKYIAEAETAFTAITSDLLCTCAHSHTTGVLKE